MKICQKLKSEDLQWKIVHDFVSLYITQGSQHFVKDVNDTPYFNVSGSDRFDAGSLFA
jgi:hypothetical protein